MEKIDFSEFDFLGRIPLNDVEGIENLVTKSKNQYLSRNKNYYKKKTMLEVSNERKRLNEILPQKGKQAFVVTEYMLNCSYRAYYAEFCNNLNNNPNSLENAKQCLEEDTKNTILSLQNKTPKKAKQNLDYSNPKQLTREKMAGDHKVILYESIKALPKAKQVICPLYDAVLVGPFFKEIHKSNYINLVFGYHDHKPCSNISQSFVNNDLEIIEDGAIIVDNDIGSGKTLNSLSSKIKKETKAAVIETSWELFKNEPKNAFDINSLTYHTFICHRHHSLTDNLVQNASDSNKYINLLKTNGLYNNFSPAHELLFNRGKTIASQVAPKVKSYLGLDSNLILSMDLMNKKIRYLEDEPFEKASRIIEDYSEVNIIDIDRHQGKKANLQLTKKLLEIRTCRVGGGIRTKEDIEELLSLGAEKVIISTNASEKLLESFSPKNIIITIDSISRKTNEERNIPEEIERFEHYCNEIQYCNVLKDGQKKGGIY